MCCTASEYLRRNLKNKKPNDFVPPPCRTSSVVYFFHMNTEAKGPTSLYFPQRLNVFDRIRHISADLLSDWLVWEVTTLFTPGFITWSVCGNRKRCMFIQGWKCTVNTLGRITSGDKWTAFGGGLACIVIVASQQISCNLSTSPPPKQVERSPNCLFLPSQIAQQKATDSLKAK